MKPKNLLQYLLPFIFAFRLLFGGMVTSVSAQSDEPTATPCANDTYGGLFVYNDSAQSLDIDALCDASAMLRQPGHGKQVYIWLTDIKPATEDDWFAKLDQFEIDHKLWDPNKPEGKQFSDNTFVFAASTTSQEAFGYNVDISTNIQNANLLQNSIADIKGTLRNGIKSGNYTAGFVNAINYATSIYMTPPATATPIPPTQPAAPIIEQTTDVNIDFMPIVRGFGYLLLIMLVGVVLFFLAKLVMAAIAKAKRIGIYTAQVKDLRQRIVLLRGVTRKALEGNSVDDSGLYHTWWLYDGHKNAPQEKIFRGHIGPSQTVWQNLGKSWSNLEFFTPTTEEAWKKLVEDLEKLLIDIIGNNAEVLALTGDDQARLFDPSLLIKPGEFDDDPWVKQAIHDSAERAPDSLTIKFLVVDPESRDTDGILGRILKAKTMIAALKKAKEDLPKAVEAVEETRRSTRIKSPVGYNDKEIFSAVDSLIRLAHSSAENELWIEAMKAVEQAAELLAKLPGTITLIDSAQRQTSKIRAEIEAIGKEKFKLDTIKGDQKEVDTDIRTAKAAVIAGDLSKAEEAASEMVSDVKRALKKAQALKALHLQNIEELKRLSREVAQAFKRLETVRPMWKSLLKYPESNWKKVGGFFDAAEVTLNALFDAPENEKDLASRITDTNGMVNQMFERAEQMLTEAFAQLQAALSKLNDVDSRLQKVKAIEDSVKATIKAVTLEIEKAAKRRTLDDTSISRAVDIAIEQAAKYVEKAVALVEAKEYTEAENFLQEAKSIALKAYADAEAEASAIKSLLLELEKARALADKTAQKATAEFTGLTPAAHKSTTANTLESVRDAWKSAKAIEGRIGDKEDKALAEALQKAMDAYRAVSELAEKVLRLVGEDLAEYKQWLSQEKQARSSAEAAIKDASEYVGADDANGHGSSALSRARNSVPSPATFGEAISSIKRKIADSEEAERDADNAKTQAEAEIRRVKQARAAEIARLAAIEKARKDAEKREQDRRDKERRDRDRAETDRQNRERSNTARVDRGTSGTGRIR